MRQSTMRSLLLSSSFLWFSGFLLDSCVKQKPPRPAGEFTVNGIVVDPTVPLFLDTNFAPEEIPTPEPDPFFRYGTFLPNQEPIET